MPGRLRTLIWGLGSLKEIELEDLNFPQWSEKSFSTVCAMPPAQSHSNLMIQIQNCFKGNLVSCIFHVYLFMLERM